MSFEIQGPIADLNKFSNGLQFVKKGMETAVMRSLNKTVAGARTDAVKLLRADYNMKAGSIRDALLIQKASVSRSEAKLYGAGSPGILLVEFRRGSRQVPSTRRLRGGGYSPKVGISVLVSKRGGKKQVKGAFVARMSSGHVGVFRRTGISGPTFGRSSGRSKLPSNRQIEELYGPSPIKIMASDRYDEEMENKLQVRWDKNIEHEADYVLKKAGLR